MKKYVLDFLHRGFVACGFGPLVLAIIYLILKSQAGLEMLTVEQVCTGIFSLSALAFVVGGTNAVYQIERLPLTVAILIHGGILYISYLCTYLLNDWLKIGKAPVLVFSGIFVIGYLAIWAVIYSITKSNTKKLNDLLEKNQHKNEDE
jgi:hypothetical protein